MNRKQLKQKSLSVFNRKTEVVVPNIIYQLIGMFVSIVSIISLPFGINGTIISTAILILHMLFYPQIIKMHMDARNNRTIKFIEYEEYKRYIKTFFIKSLYTLPNQIFYIGALILQTSLLVYIITKLSPFITIFENLLTMEGMKSLISMMEDTALLTKSIAAVIIGLPIMVYMKIKYSFIYFMLSDYKYDKLNEFQLIKESEKLISGHKMEMFVLRLSFVGWKILSYLAVIIPGVGSIVNAIGDSAIKSYMILSEIEFYYELTKNKRIRK